MFPLDYWANSNGRRKIIICLIIQIKGVYHVTLQQFSLYGGYQWNIYSVPLIYHICYIGIGQRRENNLHIHNLINAWPNKFISKSNC